MNLLREVNNKIKVFHQEIRRQQLKTKNMSEVFKNLN